MRLDVGIVVDNLVLEVTKEPLKLTLIFSLSGGLRASIVETNLKSGIEQTCSLSCTGQHLWIVLPSLFQRVQNIHLTHGGLQRSAMFIRDATPNRIKTARRSITQSVSNQSALLNQYLPTRLGRNGTEEVKDASLVTIRISLA